MQIWNHLAEKTLADKDLQKCIQNPNTIQKLVGDISCLSQAVECSIKIVSQACKLTSEKVYRTSVVHVKLRSQNALKNAETKEKNRKSSAKLMFKKKISRKRVPS